MAIQPIGFTGESDRAEPWVLLLHYHRPVPPKRENARNGAAVCMHYIAFATSRGERCCSGLSGCDLCFVLAVASEAGWEHQTLESRGE